MGKVLLAILALPRTFVCAADRLHRVLEGTSANSPDPDGKTRSQKIGVFAAALCVLSLFVASQDVLAWNYEEHASLGQSAYTIACKRLSGKYGEAAVTAWCGSNSRARCFGHMVALAGDYVLDPAGLIGRKDIKYLVRGDIDCRTPEKAIEVPPCEPASAEVKTGQVTLKCMRRKLVGSFPGKWFQYGALAAANVDHFQVVSVHEWNAHEQKLYELAGVGEKNSEKVLAEGAFALHFLQDSFAAGHVGLDRSLLQQDYGQAYHDGMNQTGQFFSDGNGNVWHGYGDGHLDAPSLYIQKKDLSIASIEKALSKDKDRSISSSAGESGIVEAMQYVQPGGVAVLSLPLERGVHLRCFLVGSCEKVEIVVELERGEPSIRQPICDGQSQDDAPLVTCHEQRARVLEASVNAAQGVLEALMGHAIEVKEHWAEATALMPANYRQYLMGVNEKGETSSNPFPLILRYGDWAKVEAYQKVGFNQWGFAVEIEDSKTPWVKKSTLIWKIKGTLDPDGKYVDLENRYDVVSSSGDLFSGFDAALYWKLPRWGKKVFGLAAKTSIGVDDVWKGNSTRNWYTGLGVSAEIHFGSTVLFFDVDRMFHKNLNGLRREGTRFVVGLSGAAINLARE